MSKSTRPKSAKKNDVNVPLRMPAELESEVVSTAAEVQLSKQDTMRQAIRRGLPILKKLLGAQQAA